MSGRHATSGMNLKRQKSIVTLAFVALCLLSAVGFFLTMARHASSPAGIHAPFFHQKLSDEERHFITSVMREQIAEVAVTLGLLVFAWAGFAVLLGLLWRRGTKE